MLPELITTPIDPDPVSSLDILDRELDLELPPPALPALLPKDVPALALSSSSLSSVGA